MPSFDVVSEVDRMEVKNAVDQAQRELSSRFDFKVTATIELDSKTGSVLLAVDDGARLKGLREIIIGKLAKRGIDLRNVEQKTRRYLPWDIHDRSWPSSKAWMETRQRKSPKQSKQWV